jgi:hypothetical protein
MKKSSNSVSPALDPEICPYCHKKTPLPLFACTHCHTEISHLREKILSTEEQKEIRNTLNAIHYAHLLILAVFLLSWLLIRTLLWR